LLFFAVYVDQKNTPYVQSQEFIVSLTQILTV